MIQAKNDLAKSTLGIKTPEQEADKHESLRELSAKIAQILKNPYIAPLRFLLVLKPLLLRLYREIHKLLISPKAATALREEDEEYFPQFKPLVADLRVRIHEIEAKLEEIEEKMTGIKERSYLFYRQLVSGIQKLEQQIQDYRREKSRYRKGHDQKVNLEIARRTFLILKLDEGFELGIWHVEQTKNNPKIPFAKT
jgi:DNA repair exonuclease SbcCD ATPase subunit